MCISPKLGGRFSLSINIFTNTTTFLWAMFSRKLNSRHTNFIMHNRNQSFASPVPLTKDTISFVGSTMSSFYKSKQLISMMRKKFKIYTQPSILSYDQITGIHFHLWAPLLALISLISGHYKLHYRSMFSIASQLGVHTLQVFHSPII